MLKENPNLELLKKVVACSEGIYEVGGKAWDKVMKSIKCRHIDTSILKNLEDPSLFLYTLNLIYHRTIQKIISRKSFSSSMCIYDL